MSRILGAVNTIVPNLTGTWYTCKEDAPTTETAGCALKAWKSGGAWARWFAVYWLTYPTPSVTSAQLYYYATWTVAASAGFEGIAMTTCSKTDSALGVTWNNLGLGSGYSTWDYNDVKRSAQNQEQSIGPCNHIGKFTLQTSQGGLVFYPLMDSVSGNGPYILTDGVTLVSPGYAVAEAGYV